MDIVRQLSVFLENKPGTLAEVCKELARHKINIFALSISDTVDHAVVRMVVDDTRKVQMLFEQRGVLVVDNEVIMIEGENKPGALAEFAARLAKAKINIEYAYMASSPKSRKSMMILRPGNVRRAIRVLTAA